MKPEWLEDELLAGASDAARLLSVGLIILADDYGNGRASIATIAAEVWRFDMSANDGEKAAETVAKASRAFRELVAVRFVGTYRVSGQTYFTIRSWTKHQRVDKPGKPIAPAPPDGLFPDVTEDSGHIREAVARDSGKLRDVPATDLEGKGPGRDQEGSGIARAPVAKALIPVRPFEEKCRELQAALRAAHKATRGDVMPPALGGEPSMQRDMASIATWLIANPSVDLSAMCARWARKRDREGKWASLGWLSRDPTEFCQEPRSESVVQLTPDQEQESIDDFIRAGGGM